LTFSSFLQPKAKSTSVRTHRTAKAFFIRFPFKSVSSICGRFH
jgi:hypothetical protein